MTARRVARLLGVAALLCISVAVVAPASASDAAQPGIALSVNGAAFGTSSEGPLLDIDGLAPGGSTSATLGVRSNMPVLSTLHLRLHDVSNNDNGCLGPERRVDPTCGAGQGDLGRTLQFSIASSAERAGPYTTRWTGTADQLERDVNAGVRVLPGDERWVRLGAALPSKAGALVESDTFGFALTVSLVGATGTAHVEAIGTHRGGTHHGVTRHGSGSGTDSVSSVLASTGLAVTLYVTAGVLLIVAGTCLAFAARRRRTASAG